MALGISKAFTGKGTVFSIGTSIATPTYTAVAELKTLAFSGSKNDTEDTTNFDSLGRAKEFAVTLLEAGEISIAGNYVAADAGQASFKAAFASGAVLPFKIVLPVAPGQVTSGDVMTFIGAVIEDNIDISYDKTLTFAAKVKISGLITYVSGA